MDLQRVDIFSYPDIMRDLDLQLIEKQREKSSLAREVQNTESSHFSSVLEETTDKGRRKYKNKEEVQSEIVRRCKDDLHYTELLQKQSDIELEIKDLQSQRDLMRRNLRLLEEANRVSGARTLYEARNSQAHVGR